MIDKDTYAEILFEMWQMARLIKDVPLAELLALADRADTLGAILHPTLYRDKSDEDREMLRAFLPVQQLMQRLKAAHAQT